MRQLNAYNLKSFYASRAGKIIARLINQRVLEIWPDVKSKRLIGYGYALPYLNTYVGGEGIKDIAKTDVFNLMPQQLGVHHWPSHADNRVCLNVEEACQIVWGFGRVVIGVLLVRDNLILRGRLKVF